MKTFEDIYSKYVSDNNSLASSLALSQESSEQISLAKFLSKEISNMYPALQFLNPKKTKEILESNNVSQLVLLLSKSVNEDIIPRIDRYELTHEDVRIIINGYEKIFPLVDIQEFIEQNFKINKHHKDYYLTLSFLCQTKNFEIIQLFKRV